MQEPEWRLGGRGGTSPITDASTNNSTTKINLTTNRNSREARQTIPRKVYPKTYTTRYKRMAKILKTLLYNQKEKILIKLENISLRTLI